MKKLRCDQTPAWAALNAHFNASGKHFDVREAFAQDARRFEAFSQDAPHVFADLSKNLIDADSQALLLALARQCGLEQQRDAMFAGELINSTENRAVMHFLLRNPPLAQYTPAQAAINKIADAQAEVEVTLNAMLAYAEQVRADAAITDIVNIGIGGSDLGPQMAVLALNEFATAGKRLHFVSNIDGDELAGVLGLVKPESTLFLIASKTFTTTETMTNARSAKAWFEAQGGQDIARHFAALTTNVAAANEFGITTTFGFWDWVGGRYSLWSAIGLPVAIAIGAAGFREFLAGAHAMDEHFRNAALEDNLPVRLGLLDVWYRNFHGFASRSIAPVQQRAAPLAGVSAAAGNGKQRQARGQGRPAFAVRHLARALGRAWHQRAACLFPDAAPGNGGRSGRVRGGQAGRAWVAGTPRQVAGQRARPGAGADARQKRRRRPPGFSRQPAKHLFAAGAAHARQPGRPDCAAGAPRVCQRRDLGHQQL